MTDQKPKFGDRVIAMRNANKETCYIYGYGVFKETVPDTRINKLLASLPQEMVEEMKKTFREMGYSDEEIHQEPVILLDSGETLRGSQCHWGPVEKFESWLKGRTIEIVPVPTAIPTPTEEEKNE